MEDVAPGHDPLDENVAVPEVDAFGEPQKIPSANSKSKKRASRACLPCRSRKVRCIVTSSKEPCINCRLDEKECVFVARSKIVRGLSRRAADVQEAAKSSASPPHSDSKASEDENATYDFNEPLSLDEDPMAEDPIPVDLPPPDLPPILNSYDFGAPSVLDIPQFSSNCPEPPQLECPWIPQSASQRLLFDPTNPDYSILEAPKTQSLSPEDLDYLYRQGCFVVPHRKILNEFIQQYFLHIHPMLPMLNEADFWALYLPNESDGASGEKLPLIVLQGIFFTSCSFVSRSTIEILGFKTVHDAKSAFYKRAKLLYDFGLETSSISISQAALLLSQSHLIPLPHGDCKQLGPMWLGIAIHYARDAGAHRYHSILTHDAEKSTEKAKLSSVLKRLWWCCVIRDRLMPLTSRRTIKITHSNFNFTGNPLLGRADLADEIYKSRVYDPATKMFLAEVLEKLVQLCVILTEVLTLTFLMYDDPPHASANATTEETRIGDCRMALRRWYSSVLRLRSAQGGDVGNESEIVGSHKRSTILFMNLLEMYYHSSRMVLCHYEILYCSLADTSLHLSHSASDTQESSNELQSAVSQLTQCLRKLVQLRLARWLPISAVGCTAFPLALQILDVKLFNSTHTPTREPNNVPLFARHKQQQLNVLIEAMKTYRPRYDGVDWVAKSVRYLVDLAHKHLPMLESRSDNTISSWTEILQLYPKYYLRLAMTMDLSIRNGKIPQESDFPPTLRGVFNGRALMSPMSILLIPPNMNSTNHIEENLEEEQNIPETFSHPINVIPPNRHDMDTDEGLEPAQGASWDASMSSPSTTTSSAQLGMDPLILELGFEAGILSPLVDMEFTTNDMRQSDTRFSMSPTQWAAGLSSYEAASLGISNEEPALESLLEV